MLLETWLVERLLQHVTHYGYGEYEIYSMTQQRQSEQMSHFQMLLLLGSNTVGHILKQLCDVVYNGNPSLKC